MSRRIPIFAELPVLAVIGCSSQAETDYRGEPLATVSGRVENPDVDHSPGELVAAIVWGNYATGVHGLTGSAVKLEGTFPADFSLELYEPPPPDAFIGSQQDDGPIGWGWIVAIRAEDVRNQLTSDAIQGISMDSGVLYFRDDLPEDSPEKEYAEAILPRYGATPTPGYHMLAAQQTPLEDWYPCSAAGLCVERVGGSSRDSLGFDWCMEYYEQPEICRIHEEPQSDEEAAETIACYELTSARDDAQRQSGVQCPLPLSFSQNPQGFERRVTLTLGAGLDEWFGYEAE